jgi:hypothetical protein
MTDKQQSILNSLLKEELVICKGDNSVFITRHWLLMKKLMTFFFRLTHDLAG